MNRLKLSDIPANLKIICDSGCRYPLNPRVYGSVERSDRRTVDEIKINSRDRNIPPNIDSSIPTNTEG